VVRVGGNELGLFEGILEDGEDQLHSSIFRELQGIRAFIGSKRRIRAGMSYVELNLCQPGINICLFFSPTPGNSPWTSTSWSQLL
jgi:hypothetical protein